MSSLELPPYTIRRSKRARHVRLQVNPADGIVVVVPPGFDTRRVPGLLETKHAWLKRRLSMLERIERDPTPPEIIEIKALGESWPVIYRPQNSASVTARHTENELILSGAIDDHWKSRAALRRWLARQAKLHLLPWLERLSIEHALPFRKVTIRGQKTRWGSCSSKQTISLNYQLLLLDAELARYVLIHELCHTRHLHHGPAFWQLVGQLEPNHRPLHQRLKTQWERLPGWVG